MDVLQQLPCLDAQLFTSRPARDFWSSLALQLGRPSTNDKLLQFYDVLDTLLSANLGWWVADYVAEVCADPTVTSDNPVDKYLVDARSVLTWCTAAAAALRERLCAALSAPQDDDDNASDRSAPTQIQLSAEALLHIVSALQAAAPSENVQELSQQLQLSRQAASALVWAARHHLLAAPSASDAAVSEWRARLEAQRPHLPGSRLFLEDVLQEVAAAGCGGMAYPFRDVCDAISSLFLAGSPAPDATHAKAACLLYYLLDAGLAADAADLAAACGATASAAAQWECHWRLDVAEPGTPQGAASVSRACGLLCGSAQPGTPFRFVEALLAAGRPHAALAVQRARAAPHAAGAGASSSLSEQQVLLRVRLECGLLLEAVAEMQAHCARVAPARRAQHVRALVAQLADWAVSAGGSGALQSLAQLPLGADEEGCLLEWLTQRAERGLPGGEALPLLLLQRGRTPEALLAFARWQSSAAGDGAGELVNAAPTLDGEEVMTEGWSGGGDGAPQQRQQLRALMAAAAAGLPPSLRSLRVAVRTRDDGSSGSGGGVLPLSLGFVGEAGVAPATVAARGAEPPVFVAPLVAAANGGASPSAGDARTSGVEAGADGIADMDVGFSGPADGASVAAASESQAAGLAWPRQGLASLFDSPAPRATATAADGTAVQLLFDVGTSGPPHMSPAEFDAHVLGLTPTRTVSAKRAREVPSWSRP